MKRRNVVVTRRALRDLDRIYERIKERSSALTASRYVARIRRHLRTLSTVSERGNDHASVRGGLRSVGFERRVQIAFDVKEDQVIAVRVFYGGENWQSTIESMVKPP